MLGVAVYMRVAYLEVDVAAAVQQALAADGTVVVWG